MTQSICILDYGSGNVKSVFNMISLLSDSVIISNEPSAVSAASHLILPGVGAFHTAMELIKERIDIPALEHEVFTNKKPFLGICVGMQVLADTGFEFGEHPGLGWISGQVKKIDAQNLPLPHVGWNNIEVKQKNPLVRGLTNESDFYFVHSFAFEAKDPTDVVATTEYSQDFCSIVAKENIFGVQFHPEKSQKAGEVLLQNFLEL